MSDDIFVDKVLGVINSSKSPITSLELAKQLAIDHQKVIGAIKSITTLASATTSDFLRISNLELRTLDVTEEGLLIVSKGSHEVRIFNQVIKFHPDGLDQSSLLKSLDDTAVAKVGFSKAMKNGWINIEKTNNKVIALLEHVDDTIQLDLKSIISKPEFQVHDENMIKELKKRKLVTDNITKYMLIEKGDNFSLNIERLETDMTTSLLQSGDWKDKKFKEYNFNSLGVITERGYLHPLLKIREQFRQIFLEMGFAEMPTNNYIESSFWNFDTLIVPQAHPARDSQDTFFLSFPEFCRDIEDRELVKEVSLAHQGSEAGTWPKGYQYDWSEKESSRNVLRTHTTAVTSRMLYKLGKEHIQSGDIHFKAAKLFSIDKVFRNETLDATHLAEFNQVEGVVVDEGLTLGDLIGVLTAFFDKLGISQLRFKPAYNPYTEPSMEIFSYHPGLSKWVEIGNSGVFRPEMLKALGLPESVTAIAWGLSLERPTMIKYKIDNIRDLVGHKVNLEMIQTSPLCLIEGICH